MKRFALLALLVVMLFGVMAPAAFAADANPVQAAAEQYFSGGPKTIKAGSVRQPERWRHRQQPRAG